MELKMELTMNQKNELTKTRILSQKGLTGRPWTDPEVQKVAEEYFSIPRFGEGTGLEGKINCLEVGLKNGNITEKDGFYLVKTEDGKKARFATRLGAEKMFFLLDEDGYWNGQYSKETFSVD